MKRPRALLKLLPLFAVVVLLPGALAQEGHQHSSSTGGNTPVQQESQQLFNIITLPAIIVGAFVYLILFEALILFRKGRRHRRVSRLTESLRLEIAWTIAPAVVLVAVSLLSINALQVIEFPPQGTVDVKVIGRQWSWTFEYPDNTTSQSILRVAEGEVVRLHVTSLDVIHSFWIPDLWVKIDAIPGRINNFWFQPQTLGTFFAQCAEFCGTGHSGMHASVVVFPAGSQPKPYGSPATPGASPPPPTETPGVVAQTSGATTLNVELLDPGVPASSVCTTLSKFCILPTRLDFQSGLEYHIHVWNNGSAQHNLTFGWTQQRVALEDFIKRPMLDPKQNGWMNFTLRATEGAYYWCNVPGHREEGMIGSAFVDGQGPGGSTGPPELPIGQYAIIATIAVGFVVLGVYHVRASRQVRRGNEGDHGHE